MPVDDFVFRVVERTHVGLVRKLNEDDVWHGQTPIGFFYVVADGMGGHAGGEVASNLVVTLLMERCAHSDPNADPTLIMKDALYHANMQIFKTAAANTSLHGMGSTAVAVLIRDGKAYVAHVGDSRIYIFRNDKLHRLTIDHTLVQMLVASGVLTEEEAVNHPRSNILKSAVGCNPDAMVDILPEPVVLTGGDLILLCSDGLHGMISDETIAAIMRANVHEPDRLGDRLIQAALEAGGSDNVTAQIIQVIGPYDPKVRPLPRPRQDLPPPDEIEDTKRYILGADYTTKRRKQPFVMPPWVVLTIGALLGITTAALTMLLIQRLFG